jgi:hypothetical protein
LASVSELTVFLSALLLCGAVTFIFLVHRVSRKAEEAFDEAHRRAEGVRQKAFYLHARARRLSHTLQAKVEKQDFESHLGKLLKEDGQTEGGMKIISLSQHKRNN